MSYYVRFLTPSEKVIPFKEIAQQGQSIKLVSGTDTAWEKIEIYEPEDNLICRLERLSVSFGSPADSEINRLKDSIRQSEPASARAWIRNYLTRVKAIYTFQVFPDNITWNGWPVLGRVQNLHKDLLTGIIQADNEGYYNETGDYILWQMYEGATGSIPSAVLKENGEWISYQLNLNDAGAAENFKQGLPPRRGFLSRLLGR